uniref:Putative secreted protein n=1 Tax=Anopheles marajoara TaxID=58244 RepID=A0A2M4C7V2_9DIPT
MHRPWRGTCVVAAVSPSAATGAECVANALPIGSPGPTIYRCTRRTSRINVPTVGLSLSTRPPCVAMPIRCTCWWCRADTALVATDHITARSVAGWHCRLAVFLFLGELKRC